MVRGDDRDHSDQEQDGGKDDYCEKQKVADRVDSNIHIITGSAHESRHGEHSAQCTGDAAEQGNDGQGDDLADGDMTAFDRRHQERGDGTAFLLASDGFRRHGHAAGE